MSRIVRQFLSFGFFSALSLVVASPAFAQTSVIVEVKVLQMSRTELDQMGTASAWAGFAKPLPKYLVTSLASGAGSKTLQRIDLQATGNKVSQLRVDSRVSVIDGSSSGIQAFYEAGIGMDVTPKVFQNRDIVLAITSQVRIRRGADVAGLANLFQTPMVQYETRVREGETIAVGGFITDAQRTSLPELSMLPDNPILNYLFPKSRQQRENSEIMVLMTPRIVGAVVDAEPVVSVKVPPEIVDKPVPVAEPVLPPPVTFPPVVAAGPVTAPPAVPAAAPFLGAKQAGGMYTVQVGAFDNAANAAALVRELSVAHDAVSIGNVPGRTPYRVRIGRFPDMQTARKVEQQLIREGYRTYVTKVD